MSLLNKKRMSIRRKTFIGVGLFVILNILINVIIVRISSNDIYLSLERRELRNQYYLLKNSITDENSLINVMYNANSNGIKIKILDNNLNVLYSIINDRVDGNFTNMDLLLLDSLGSKQSSILTLKNHDESGYDLYFVGRLNNGYAILSSSIESLKKDAKTTSIILIFTSFITFLILLIIAYFISKILSKKVDEVKQVTSDISNLKFGKKVRINTNDELSDLFDNINEMSVKLENSIKELEVANERLRQDLNQKEKQEKARKQLIANISHEFKTPLTIISGYIQLIMPELESGENKQNAELIIKETEWLSELVREFLELSRLESGSVKLNKTEVDMDKLINEEIRKLSVKTQSEKIRLTFNSEGNQTIKVDQKQITRVVQNILTNAIKFCKGDKIINVKTYREGEFFVYDVFNTGDNIDNNNIENIFSSYYKEKNTRNKEGTGLGLTIVNAIVNLHDGNCICQNEPDGVRFIVKIRCK